MSTTFHSQTDKQTEHMNQILKYYLCCYINYQQNNWVKLLLSAKYVYNNSIQMWTEKTSFKLCYHFKSVIHMWTKDESMKSKKAPAVKEVIIKVNNDIDKAKNIWEWA